MNRRQCPACESDSLLSVKEARLVYGSLSRFGADALLEDASRLCTWCRAVKMDDGTWDRLMSVDERAWNLSQAGSKSKEEYAARLTSGELPSSDGSSGTGTGEDSDGGGVSDTGRAW